MSHTLRFSQIRWVTKTLLLQHTATHSVLAKKTLLLQHTALHSVLAATHCTTLIQVEPNSMGYEDFVASTHCNTLCFGHEDIIAATNCSTLCFGCNSLHHTHTGWAKFDDLRRLCCWIHWWYPPRMVCRAYWSMWLFRSVLQCVAGWCRSMQCVL